MRGLSNLPPGTPTGWDRESVTLRCPNDQCPEFLAPVTATSAYERDTGWGGIEPEGAKWCEECGKEMKSD